MRHAQLIAALQFICTEYGLDKEKGPVPKVGKGDGPVKSREEMIDGPEGPSIHHAGTIERAPNGNVKSRAEYPPE